jgi:hypothetical protein
MRGLQSICSSRTAPHPSRAMKSCRAENAHGEFGEICDGKPNDDSNYFGIVDCVPERRLMGREGVGIRTSGSA